MSSTPDAGPECIDLEENTSRPCEITALTHPVTFGPVPTMPLFAIVSDALAPREGDELLEATLARFDVVGLVAAEGLVVLKCTRGPHGTRPPADPYTSIAVAALDGLRPGELRPDRSLLWTFAGVDRDVADQLRATRADRDPRPNSPEDIGYR